LALKTTETGKTWHFRQPGTAREKSQPPGQGTLDGIRINGKLLSIRGTFILTEGFVLVYLQLNKSLTTVASSLYTWKHLMIGCLECKARYSPSARRS
jgi:hypothetical protein